MNLNLQNNCKQIEWTGSLLFFMYLPLEFVMTFLLCFLGEFPATIRSETVRAKCAGATARTSCRVEPIARPSLASECSLKGVGSAAHCTTNTTPINRIDCIFISSVLSLCFTDDGFSKTTNSQDYGQLLYSIPTTRTIGYANLSYHCVWERHLGNFNGLRQAASVNTNTIYLRKISKLLKSISKKNFSIKK